MNAQYSESREGMRLHEKSCHAKLNYFLSHLPMLLVGAALIVVICAGIHFLSLLIDNIKDTRFQMRRFESSRMSMLPYSCALIEEDNPVDHFCKAYEELDRELTSWLTILTIAGALFGLIAPLIGYLLQHHKLKEDRNEINKVLSDFKIEQREKYREIRQDLMKINGLIAELKRFKVQCGDDVQRTSKIANDVQNHIHVFSNQIKKWEWQVVAFAEYSIAEKLNNPALGDSGSPADIANLIIAFDYLLECLIHWNNDGAIVRAKIIEWILNIKALWSEIETAQQEKVLVLLRGVFKPSSEFASRTDVLKFLRADSDEFEWLEEFYRPFAPWKFM